MTTKAKALAVIGEIEDVIARMNEGELEQFSQEIMAARCVFLFGFGRTLLMMKSSAMRLMHLGITAHVVGDVTTPAIGHSDLLILGICFGRD